jgi:hypothetical protein
VSQRSLVVSQRSLVVSQRSLVVSQKFVTKLKQPDMSQVQLPVEGFLAQSGLFTVQSFVTLSTAATTCTASTVRGDPPSGKNCRLPIRCFRIYYYSKKVDKIALSWQAVGL